MALLHQHRRYPAGTDLEKDRWQAQAVFGLFVAGLMAWLVVLYCGGPLDF